MPMSLEKSPKSPLNIQSDRFFNREVVTASEDLFAAREKPDGTCSGAVIEPHPRRRAGLNRLDDFRASKEFAGRQLFSFAGRLK